MFTELVISGASTNFMAILGALECLQEHSYLQQITRFVGTSIGSVICLLLAIGYTPQFIQQVTLQCNFDEFHEITCDNVLSFFDNLGIISGDKIIRLIGSFLQQKQVPPDITFSQFRDRFHKSLFITTWCLHDKDSVCMSHRNHPDMEILLAIRMSISIPFLFKPVTWLGKMYVDGAMFDNYPVRFAKKKHSIGIHVDILTEIKQPIDITNYINVIVRSVTKIVTRYTNKKYKHPLTIEILLPDNDLVNFDLTSETKQYLFNLGKQQASEFIEKNITDKK